MFIGQSKIFFFFIVNVSWLHYIQSFSFQNSEESEVENGSNQMVYVSYKFSHNQCSKFLRYLICPILLIVNWKMTKNVLAIIWIISSTYGIIWMLNIISTPTYTFMMVFIIIGIQIPIIIFIILIFLKAPKFNLLPFLTFLNNINVIFCLPLSWGVPYLQKKPLLEVISNGYMYPLILGIIQLLQLIFVITKNVYENVKEQKAQYTKNEMEVLNPVGNWLKDSNFVFHPPSSHVRR